MKIYTYDFEVFRYDWIGIFKDKNTSEYTVIHNAPLELRDFLNSDAIYVGFNTKNYDQFIVKAICNDPEISPEEIKELNDWIIAAGAGWEHPLIRGNWYGFNNVDIRDDCQIGLSLKAIEGHLGMSIEESNVSFDIDHPLTQEEYDETIKYCKHDVDTTEHLIDIRKEYLKNKMAVGRMVGLDDAKSLSMTNAKLTAALLKAERPLIPRKDERQYKYPENLKKEYIPQEVFDFFNRMYDPNISDEDLFKSKLELDVGECPVTIAYGGIHGAIPFYSWDEDSTRIIRNYDVSSYYPHLMTVNGYTSRNIPSVKVYENVLNRRMEAKAKGDKSTANALKLVCNTTYGATLNQFNDLYDPLMARSVCISGQLYLLEMAEHLLKDVPDLKICQCNTDGIMIEFDVSQYDKVKAITNEWQTRTGFELEEDCIKKLVQKDVNSYIEVQSDGKVKQKGGYLVRGIAPAGAFNINNNATIVAKAITDYFVDGTSVEDTINACDDIMAFQQIAKAGAKYKEAYHIVNGEQVPIQKVNRVYATKDERYGKLYKIKAETDMTAKIEMLPEHCIIDNDNRLSIDDIDKSFYIEMAKKRINDFMGIKPEKKGKKKMAATSTKNTQNIYKRLATVREKFLEHGIAKTGKNPQLKAMYFQLDDIVPVSTPMFHENDLFPMMNFTKDECTLSIIDMLDDTNKIVFSAPVREWLGNAAVTPVQAMGATITYMRRYLYQIALDIVETDEMESGKTPTQVEKSAAKPVVPKPTIPLTPEAQKATIQNATEPDGAANELQITQLKKKLKDMRSKIPGKPTEDWIADIAVKTNAFTTISKKQCEEILTEIAARLENAKNG